MQSLDEPKTAIKRCDITTAWNKIAPCWPLKNVIACNPLQGFEDLPFEQAVNLGQSHFQLLSLPTEMDAINRETIKWCQAFFDEGQAKIHMPLRNQGLYHAWRQLAQFDLRLHRSNTNMNTWLANLPLSAEQTIADCLAKLNIPIEQRSLFFTLLLTTLPGWASYVKYQSEWANAGEINANTDIQTDYLAMRLVITCLLWQNAKDLLSLQQKTYALTTSKQTETMISAENNYKTTLINALAKQINHKAENSELPTAQIIFCIDVRSEPFRRALEAQGHYETLGFAGFFGIPTQINNELSDTHYSACPVLLKPKHTINEIISCSNETRKKVVKRKSNIKQIIGIYSSLKYTFTTPFVLAEALGPWSGLWMALKTMSPNLATTLKLRLLNLFQQNLPVEPLVMKQFDNSGIDLSDQCAYAENALRIMGFTDHFSPLVVLCGHGSETQNNAYASALDCGACGGHSGAANARILANILNQSDVRNHLKTKNIIIPITTTFIAALHNTTTDEVTFYADERIKQTNAFNQLKVDFENARNVNNRWRCQQLGYTNSDNDRQVKHRSRNWAETRPEWGLARNAAFIIGQRAITKHINLEGRAFLHSYDFQQDSDGRLLTTILTAPMIVAQWINSQYLFSSLDNIVYGSGSKITQNITSKIGIMQGNASDLMHGLPLQSVYQTDDEMYHEPLRLMTIVHAPNRLISEVISNQPVLQKLFGNGWVSLMCIDPMDNCFYQLQRDLTWDKTENEQPYDLKQICVR